MKISFEKIKEGYSYDRPALAKLWGLGGFEAISRGVFTPSDSNHVILFVTKNKQKSLTQYKDYIQSDKLYWEGEAKGRTDQKIVEARLKKEQIHLFYRERHHEPFIYFGKIELLRHTKHFRKPTRFVFNVERTRIISEIALAVEEATHGQNPSGSSPKNEGTPRLRLHRTYERSRANRIEALRIHGTQCNICGFDFDKVYGADWASGYIEVHHIRSLARNPGKVDPRFDLLPVCSNCHSMLHRSRPEPHPPKMLKLLLKRRRKTNKGTRIN